MLANMEALARFIIYTLWMYVYYDIMQYDSIKEKQYKDQGEQSTDVWISLCCSFSFIR